MEKTVNIGGKKIKLKANARNLLVYRDAFSEDMLRPQWNFIDNARAGALDKMDGLELAKITWTLAKTADSSVEDFDNWLDSFDSFPVIDVVNALTDVVLSNLTSITPIKNEKATGKGEKKS